MMQQDQQKTQRRGQIPLQAGLNADPFSMVGKPLPTSSEDGVDRRFIQEAAGHRCDTSTAIYTHVSGDFMNTALRKALAPALGRPPG